MINIGNSPMGKVKQWFKKMDWRLNTAMGGFYIGFTLGLIWWFTDNWPNLLTAPVYSLWIFLLWAIGGGLVGKLSELKLSKKEKDNLEMLLKKKGLEFEIFNPISQENLNNLIERLFKALEFFLDIVIPQNPIEYYPEKQVFKIFYDGKLKSKEIILKILIKNFKNEFTIKSII